MKKILFALILCICSLSAVAQNSVAPKNSKQVYYVTETMCNKIAYNCLNGLCYTRGTFYSSNKDILPMSDIIEGKGIEILASLYKYPEHAENFIYFVYHHFRGDKGLKRIGFDEEEIEISYKIIKNRSKE